MRSRARLVFTLLVLAGLVPAAQASVVVTLSNGKTVEGDIAAETAEKVVIKVNGLALTYYRDQIVDIKTQTTPKPRPALEIISGGQARPSGDYSVEILSSQQYVIPKTSQFFVGKITGLALQGSKIYYASDGVWGECSYRGGQVVFDGFLSGTPGYKIKAVGVVDGMAAIFDAQSNSIQYGRGIPLIKVSRDIGIPAGLAQWQGAIYLGDRSMNKIYKVMITGSSVQIVQEFPAPQGLCGLASDGRFLYACTQNMIYKYDSGFNIVKAYKSPVNISGIGVVQDKEFVASAVSGNILYILK